MSAEQMHFENCLSVAKSKEERLLQLLVTAGYKSLRHSSLTSGHQSVRNPRE